MVNSKSKYLKPFNNMQKMSSTSFTNVTNKICLQIIFNMNIHKHDLALNNLQWLMS